MPFNTNAALYAYEARKHAPEQASYCQLCGHVLESSDALLHWLRAREAEHAFVNKAFLDEMLLLGRTGRLPLTRRYLTEGLGFSHVINLDSHGRDGAVVVDFNEDISSDPGYRETFDVVDNCGVTEHVFDQRAVFANIHRLCKPGGIMTHRIPMYGIQNIYLFGANPLLFTSLAAANRYEILDLRVGNRWGDTVPVRLPGRPPPESPFRAFLPARPGHLRGVGTEGPGDDETLLEAFLPEELHLPDSVSLEEMISKTPLWNLDHPMTRVFHALEKRALPFRPQAAGEVYAMALLRKMHDEPFRVPYQQNNLADIESPAMRDRYRHQFSI